MATPTNKEINEVLERLEPPRLVYPSTTSTPDYDFAAAPSHLRQIVYNGTVWFHYRRWWTRLLWWRR